MHPPSHDLTGTPRINDLAHGKNTPQESDVCQLSAAPFGQQQVALRKSTISNLGLEKVLFLAFLILPSILTLA
jgi:hypothetical protein